MVAEIKRIGAVRKFVRNFEGARRFYADLLGLPERIDGEEFSAFRLAGTDVVIEIANGEQDDLVGRFTGVSFAVADIEATVAELAAANVAIAGAPEKQDWGGILAHVADPDGNEITLVEYPGQIAA